MARRSWDEITTSVHADWFEEYVMYNFIGDQRDTLMKYARRFREVIEDRDEAQRELTESLRASVASSGALIASLVQHTLDGDIRWGDSAVHEVR